MTTVNDNLIDNLSHLSRLEFEGEEREKIKKDLEKVIDFCNKLSAVDTTELEPLVYIAEEQNVIREDKVVVSISKEEALKNAPKKDSDYFRVPKVIESK